MSTMPPEPPAAPPPPAPGYTGLGRTATTGAILPVPGNAELAIYLLAVIVLAIIWAASDLFSAPGFAQLFTWLTIGYILSLEGADSILTPARLERSFADGLRALGPAHYGPGRYAPGTNASGGLEPPCRELLREMGRLGIILDAH